MRCVYCGTDGGRTRDHVPPKSLIRQPYPANLWTVPSCAECNQGFSKDEEYFRLMVLGMYCHTPEAEELFDGPVSRSMDRNPNIEELMFGSLRATKGVAILDLDYPRIFRIAEKIVRGLRFVLTGTEYARDQQFDVHFFEVDAESEATTFGPDFTYKMIEEGGPSWEFTFFGSLRFIVEPA